jgi:oligoribonuclease
MGMNLVWIDLEMSSLDPEDGVILEIATIITDDDLGILEEGPNIAINHSKSVLDRMDEWNQSHHQASGLLDRVKTSTYDGPRAEAETMAFISKYCREGESPLCGNTVWQDRRFLVRHMPRLEDFFHYRIIDVSTIKELVRRWYPSLPRFPKKKAHLALSDIRESIDELRYYRKHIFLR